MTSIHTSGFKKHLVPLAFASLSALVCLPASAVLVTSRAVLAAQDFVDWGQLGASFSMVAQPAVATSNLGFTAAATQVPVGSFFVLNAVDHSGNLGGNILATDLGSTAPISISFSTALSGVGAQIQSNDFGAFTGVIKAYGSTNLLLETQSFAGVSNGAQNNSAIFLGLSRASADIRRVEFSVITATANLELAINQLDMQLQPIPEPASVALFAVGLAGLVGWNKSRRKSA
jgi:PEP-CTERM motif